MENLNLKSIINEAQKNKSIKSKFIVFIFRMSQCLNYKPSSTKYIYLPFYLINKFIIENFMGVEIPYNAQIKEGLKIFHSYNIVISPHSIIGRNCIIRNGVTIGNKHEDTDCPVIGDNVSIGACSILIGNITVGDNVTIGAGSVCIKNIPANSIVAGNPAKPILKRFDHA